MNLIKPKKLNAGDTVAVVSPSWGGAGRFPHRYEAGKRQLAETFGVNVVEMPNTCKPAEWVHAHPEARAEDLMQAFADSKVDAIFASIGGDDSIRLLPYLDMDVIRNNPKIFMGYSDSTVLHFACLKAGVTSFYGPSIMAGFAENAGLFPYMEDSVRRTLFSNSPVGEIAEAEEWTVEHLDWSDSANQLQKRKLRKPVGRQYLQGEGVVQGALIGGCIDVFPMLLGTGLWPEKAAFDNAILFIETSEEAPLVDDIKRIMRNLGVQGILERLNGILIGRPGGNVENLRQYDAAIQEVVAHEFNLQDLVLVSQLDFGHTDPMFVLPYGVKAEINCEDESVSLLENACV